MLAVLVEVPITRPSSHIWIAQLVATRSAAAAVVQALASDSDDLPADADGAAAACAQPPSWSTP